MARVSVPQTNFTAGELSPRLRGRTDIAKYPNGAKRLFNALPTIYGGVRKRFGTRIVDTQGQFHDVGIPHHRIVPFVISAEQAYCVIYSDSAFGLVSALEPAELPDVRLRGAGAQTTAAGIFSENLTYAQGGSTMFVFQRDKPVRTTVRRPNSTGSGAGLWATQYAVFDSPPASDVGERQNTTCTASATTGTVTLTAGSAAFRNADVGRYYEDTVGRAKITAFTSTTVVTAVVEVTLASGAVAANAWKLIGPPIAQITPGSPFIVGSSITLTAGVNTWKDGTFATSHIGAAVEINGGLAIITAVGSATVATAEVFQSLSSATAAPARSWRLLFNPWNAIDGYPRCGALFQQRLYAGATPAQPQSIWATNIGEYYNFSAGINDDAGFSFEVSSDQADSIQHFATQTDLLIYTSGGEFVLRGGVEQAVGPTNVQIKPQSTYGCADVRPARVGRETLFVQLHGKKIRAQQYAVESDALVAPDMSVLAEHITGIGIKRWAYAAQPESILWMLLEDGTIGTLSYDRDQDVFAYARHELEGAVVVDLCVIPFDGGDKPFLLLTRNSRWLIEYIDEDATMDHEIDVIPVPKNATLTGTGTVTADTTTAHGFTNGQTVWSFALNQAFTITVTTASTFTFVYGGSVPASSTFVGKTTSWTIGEHGAAVGVNGEDSQSLTGVYFYRDVPGGPWRYGGAGTTNASGVLTLVNPAYAVRFGIPFDMEIVTLPTEIGTGEGTAQGNASSIHELVLRLNDSMGGKVRLSGNPVNLPKQLSTFPATSPATSDPDDSFTGDIVIGTTGWGKTGSGDWDGSITLTHSDPTRFELLSLIKKTTVNSG